MQLPPQPPGRHIRFLSMETLLLRAVPASPGCLSWVRTRERTLGRRPCASSLFLVPEEAYLGLSLIFSFAGLPTTLDQSRQALKLWCDDYEMTWRQLCPGVLVALINPHGLQTFTPSESSMPEARGSAIRLRLCEVV